MADAAKNSDERRGSDGAPHDVLVVGLGPAGASAAAAAARKGARVLAVDRKRVAGEPVQCAEFVPAMIGSDVAGLSRSTVQAITQMLTFVGSDAAECEPNFPGHMIDRAGFDRRLVEVAGQAGATCQFGAQLEFIDEDGRAVMSDGTRHAARIIIGADGPRSRVGKAVGRTNRDLVETRQITVPLFAAHAATDIFLRADIQGGYAWLFPKGHVANLGLGVVPQAKARLKPLLAELHARFVAEGRVGAEVLGHTGGAIPVGGLLDPVAWMADVMVLLAGDAAGLTNPITGAGISSAVISGTLAGEAAARHLAGETGAVEDFADEIEALFASGIGRALRHRRRIMAKYAAGGVPTADDLRQSWIAYPEYWAA